MSIPDEHKWSQWGRAIFYVDDVDVFYAQAVSAGLTPEFTPQDGSWGVSDISTFSTRTGTS